MSVTEVYEQRGMTALLALVAVVAAFLALQALRMPLLLANRVLEVAQQRLDGLVVAGLPAPAADGGVGR